MIIKLIKINLKSCTFPPCCSIFGTNSRSYGRKSADIQTPRPLPFYEYLKSAVI